MSPPACGPNRPPARALEAVGERYIHLALALGVHDPDYVDAYFGPEDWRRSAERDSLPLGFIIREADSIVAAMAPSPRSHPGDAEVDRERFLRRQLQSLATRARMVSGERYSFDDESRALYDVVAPARVEADYEPLLARLDLLLPGPGPLAGRWEAFRREFIIPPARLDTVFRAAIAESRRRMREHIALPDSESFVLEFVRGQPWGGYNWYQGGYRSLIQVNTDLPIYIDRALDLACHEGYPGHHAANVLQEHALVQGRGWREFTLLPLYSPKSLIDEGVATVAAEVVFTRDEAARFEKEVLCPLAGIDTSRYARYAAVRELVDSLGSSRIEAGRRWLDGRINRDEAKRWHERYRLDTPERAEKSLRFMERYRSYIVNYGLGRETVRAWLAANGGTDADPARRWELYRELVERPRLPADLAVRR